ncbi:MAG: sugar phosphate isomerase/epimerase [Acidobacteria bacterium]|nr:sugar phosphate isomerase/epimerase [Acidobacteriota bacterium]MCI0723305.1 sugar phosphate isomerase/epimerase [Acidobacteriota bacterium]
MRLGISSYTFVWGVGVPGYPCPPQPMTVERLLEKAAELGVHVVQIADNLPLDRLTNLELDALLKRAVQSNIDLEVGTCGISPRHLGNYLRLARRLDSSLVRIVLDSENHHPSTDEVVASVGSVAPDFERAGVCLAIENHDRFKAATLAEILDRVGSTHAGICLDTANSIGCLEELVTILETLGRWIVNLHVKDFCIYRPPHKKGFIVEGRPAGQGALDIPWLLGALREKGRNPNVILELWPPPEAAISESVAKEEAWAAESIRYLRKFISS